MVVEGAFKALWEAVMLTRAALINTNPPIARAEAAPGLGLMAVGAERGSSRDVDRTNKLEGLGTNSLPGMLVGSVKTRGFPLWTDRGSLGFLPSWSSW